MEHDLAFEASYWGDCTNTFDEDQKHFVYAALMGIRQNGFAFSGMGLSILDIGGGPTSMLLKCRDLDDIGRSAVVDPLMDKYPQWVRDRYACKGVRAITGSGEDIDDAFAADQIDRLPRLTLQFDEVWIYNVLQHVEDPAKVIANARAVAPVLRLFEWIDIPAHEGHPHMLTREKLDQWTGARGTTAVLAERGCFGKAYAVVARVEPA